MEKKELEKFKSGLLKLKEELHKILESNDDYSESPQSTDEIDQATNLIEKMTGFAVSSNFYKNMKDVNEALKRIDSNSYGKCLNCDENISLKRLQILPFTKYCIDCQREFEKKP
jgi:DnaK suppressor protein